MAPLWHRCALALLGGLLVAGCAAADPEHTAEPGNSVTAPDAPAALVVEVRIAGGQVTPADQRFDAKVGQPVEIVVDSDAEDELHVHAAPQHTFAVTPGAGQRFRFSVDVPGRVEVELHHADRTVVTLLVRA
ncbi:hypothetical protein [Nocardia callitridis]|uniref:hypothetical protein n=1 Tax=Nocardia callitridis TaxID=648753 RepID=UPI0031EE22DB